MVEKEVDKDFYADENQKIKKIQIRDKKKQEERRDELLQELQDFTVPRIQKGVKGKKQTRGLLLGNKGRTITFGFGDTRQGFKSFKKNTDQPKVWEALKRFAEVVVPKGWDFTTITLNHQVQAKKHRDTKNVGNSVIIGIGEYSGGELNVWDKDDKVKETIDINNKPIMFNGHQLPHSTEPFKGNRQTIVIQKQQSKNFQPSKKEIFTGKGKSDQVVAIPSQERPDILREKTLKTLKDQGISADKIEIFVANKQQEKEQREKIDKNLYNKIIVGKKGIVQIRNFIVDQQPEGKQVVSVDDDLEGVFEKVGDKKTDKGLKKINLDKLIKKAFKLIKEKGLQIWGVNPVLNPFQMTKSITTDLRQIIGVLQGFINRHSSVAKVSIRQKEDVERSIKYYKNDGGVLRFNGIAVKTKQQEKVGGISAETGGVEKRIKEGKEAVDKLKEKQPEYLEKKEKAGGITDVRLIRNPKVEGSGMLV